MSEKASDVTGTAGSNNTAITYLTNENEKKSSARTKDSYTVRFFDGKKPGTADDGKVKQDPHPHNQNWGRTGLLLVEGGTIILRSLFDEKVKEVANGNLAVYLKMPAIYQILFDLYQGKVISPDQWGILYHTDKAHLVTSLELDIILLYILVIHTCQFKGDVLMDIQKIEKRRDSLYDFTKEAKIIDAKFDTEYEAVGAVLAKLCVSRELGRDIESRIKNMMKNLKIVTMTKEEILLYLDTVKRWYLSDIDLRKAMKELKQLLKAGDGDTKRASDILAKLKMVAEDDNNKAQEMVDIKDSLEKLADELQGIKKKKTKLKTVHNIVSILSSRFSQPFNMESIPMTIPHTDEWVSEGVQFALHFCCQGQIHVYTKSTKLVVEAKLKVLVGDTRIPQNEIAAMKTLNSTKFREQLINDLHLGGIATLTFRERSFFIVPINSNDHGYKKLLETVKIPLWKTTITNIFNSGEVKGHLKGGGCLCLSASGDPSVVVEVRCRGSDIALNSAKDSVTAKPTPYEWKEGPRQFVVKKYFLGKLEDDRKGKIRHYVMVDIAVKKGTKIDPAMESRLSEQLNNKIDLKSFLETPDDVCSVTCDDGKSTLTISFNSMMAVKEFHDRFRYKNIKAFVNKLFEEPKIKKILGSTGFSIYIDVIFSIPEVECKGLPEPSSPTAPRHLKTRDITMTSVDVVWEKPLYDGGLPLTCYVIERYDLSEKKWVMVGEAEPSDTGYHVAHLMTSHEYFFRIHAENLAGRSPLVETFDPVLLSRQKVIKPQEITQTSNETMAKNTPRSKHSDMEKQDKDRKGSVNKTDRTHRETSAKDNEANQTERKTSAKGNKNDRNDRETSAKVGKNTNKLTKSGNGNPETAVSRYSADNEEKETSSTDDNTSGLEQDSPRKQDPKTKDKKTKKKGKAKTTKSNKSKKTRKSRR